jgi:hypothetical protein
MQHIFGKFRKLPIAIVSSLDLDIFITDLKAYCPAKVLFLKFNIPAVFSNFDKTTFLSILSAK